MNFSLINKFRGAWLGSYLAAIKAPSQGYGGKFLGAGKIAGLGAQSLVQVGYLDLVHWQEQMRIMDPNLLDLARSLQISEAIWATLPVTLFYHEQPQKLAPALLLTLDFWLHAPDATALGLGVAEAIAFLLKPNPCPQEIMEQTHLGEMLNLSPQFWQELPCLELAIKEITRHTAPSHVPIAIACYCFLCTPEDFSLSIRRAKIVPQLELVTPLVGILSGAYNGLRGVPWQWYAESLSLSESFLPKSSIDLLPNLSKQVSISDAQYQLIDQLFAVWTGHYQIAANTATPWQNQIVTVPTLKG
jgi:hypothetical protein